MSDFTDNAGSDQPIPASEGGVTGVGGMAPSLACFILVAKFLGVAADPAQIAHERGKGEDPWTIEDLARISKRLGLISKIRNAVLDDFRKLPLPALAEARWQ